MDDVMKKLQEVIRQLLRCPKEFPVETLLCLSFFVIATWDTVQGFGHERGTVFNADILPLFVPLFVLTFYLHKVNRWAYIASFFLFLPLMQLNLHPFLTTIAFFFTYVLAAILLAVGTQTMSDKPFAAHLLHVVTQLAFGILVALLLYAAVAAIMASFFYIFGVDEPPYIYMHTMHLVGFVVAPLVSASFIRHNEYEQNAAPKLLQTILNFILSPAVIIYTVILYAYTLKILFTWDLPKGGVAWMVMGFIAVALVGHLTQNILPRRYFDWFYRHFTWIALPPLVLYWIGSLYRIHLYSFTESRFYLLVSGVLMTLFVLMLLLRTTGRYQFMAVITAAAIIIFTYIPGISAKSIGLRCQTSRMHKFIEQLKLTDSTTGKFRKTLNLQAICADSLLCERYREAADVIDYVRSAMSSKAFNAKYGEFKFSTYAFNYEGDTERSPARTHYDRDELPRFVNLDDYSQLLNPNAYSLRYSATDTVLTMTDAATGKVVLSYPIGQLVRQQPALMENPAQLLVYSNDSLLVVLSGLAVTPDGRCIDDMETYSPLIFRKKP